MLEDIASIRSQLWGKMQGKNTASGKRYREAFVSAHLSTNISAQIVTMREARGWLQRELAEKADMSAARISVMENPSYENLNVKTLKRIAAAFDVALIIRFAAFSELATWAASASPERLNAPSFQEDSLPNDVKSDSDFIAGMGSVLDSFRRESQEPRRLIPPQSAEAAAFDPASQQPQIKQPTGYLANVQTLSSQGAQAA